MDNSVVRDPLGYQIDPDIPELAVLIPVDSVLSDSHNDLDIAEPTLTELSISSDEDVNVTTAPSSQVTYILFTIW